MPDLLVLHSGVKGDILSTLTVNSWELDVLVSVADIQVEGWNAPLATILIPVRLRPDLLQLKPRKGNLHDIVGEFAVLI